jgi:protein SCO1/2
MKLRFILISLCALTLIAIVSAIALNQRNQPVATAVPGQQIFQVKGVVRVLESDGKTVKIEHEEIPDYMPAMTMPFEVKEPTVLKNLEVGDAIEFKLVVTETDSWIDRVELLQSAPPNLTANSTSENSATRDLNKIDVGDSVPNFSLTNQNGQAVSLSDFKGKAILVTFIYTRCPIPNYCPLLSKNFAELQQRFAKEFPGRVQLLSISFDPKFDTSEVLKKYSAQWSRDESNWTFATGSPEQIANVAGIFGTFYETQGAVINHDLRTALISPDGKLIHIWKSNVWTPYEVQRMVRETLTGARDVAAKADSGRKN